MFACAAGVGSNSAEGTSDPSVDAIVDATEEIAADGASVDGAYPVLSGRAGHRASRAR